MRGRIVLALALAATTLQGCAAAVIPAIAATAIGRKQLGKRPAPPRRAAAVPAYAVGTATLTPLTALPAPAGGTPVDATMRFVDHALRAAAQGETPAHSMILSEGSRLDQVAFMPCAAKQPLAVAIDAGLASAPRLAEALRRLRAFDVEVLWIADVAEVDALRAALKASGAWAAGDAPILTTGAGVERKQQVRREATRAFCIVAVAGGKRGDVEELYSFLRDPVSALPLERYWNAGWFVLPAKPQ